MSRNTALTLAVALVMAAVVLAPGASPVIGAESTTSTTAPDASTTTMYAPEGHDRTPEGVVHQYMAWLGWTPDMYTLDLNAAYGPEERSSGAFGDSTIYTNKQLRHALSTPGERMDAARQAVYECLYSMGYDLDEYYRWQAGEHHIGVVLLTESRYEGTGFYRSGEVHYGNRTAAAGDVVWIYVSTDVLIPQCTNVRADCQNPGGAPKPVKPPPPGTTTTTTIPSGSTTTTTVVQPKDPSKDVNVNPDVPENVQGPGTTPVGGDPGPPDDPSTHDPTNPDVQDDGYCQTGCGDHSTHPPDDLLPPPGLPDEGDPGSGESDDGTPIEGGGDEGISDPEPEPDPPPDEGPVDSPPVGGGGDECPPDICG